MKPKFSCSWSVWSQSISGSALNLSQLARLLSQTGISVDLRHGKRDAYNVGLYFLTPCLLFLGDTFCDAEGPFL